MSRVISLAELQMLGEGAKLWLLCQQALLQLLVMNHEQEREHLTSLLLNGVSLEDLQDRDCDLPKKEGTMILPPSSAIQTTCCMSHQRYLL